MYFIMKSKTLLNLLAMAILCLAAASCESTNPLQNNDSLVGKWTFVDRDYFPLEITESKITLLLDADSSTPYRTLPYKWISEDSIEIEYYNWGGLMADYFTTRNKVIFHTLDSVSITDWFYGQNEVDAPIYGDATIVKMTENNSLVATPVRQVAGR